MVAIIVTVSGWNLCTIGWYTLAGRFLIMVLSFVARLRNGMAPASALTGTILGDGLAVRFTWLDPYFLFQLMC